MFNVTPSQPHRYHISIRYSEGRHNMEIESTDSFAGMCDLARSGRPAIGITGRKLNGTEIRFVTKLMQEA